MARPANYQSVLANYIDLCLAFTASTKPEDIVHPLMSELKALYFDQSQHQIVSVFLKKLTSIKHRAILILSLNPLRKEVCTSPTHLFCFCSFFLWKKNIKVKDLHFKCKNYPHGERDYLSLPFLPGSRASQVTLSLHFEKVSRINV